MHMEHLSTIIYIYSLILHTKNYIKKKKTIFHKIGIWRRGKLPRH
jgi:hypothetical protein